MKRGYRARQGHRRQPLIQAVEQLRSTRTQGFRQQAAARIGRQAFAPRPDIAVWTIAEAELRFGMSGGQPEKNLPGIQPHPGESIPKAIGGVQRNGQCSPYSFILR